MAPSAIKRAHANSRRPARAGGPSDARCGPDEILRFRRSERLVHWSIAIPFMLCYATALVLVLFYTSQPDRPYRYLFSWAHRLSGVCLFLCPTVVLLRNLKDARVHLYNIREAWIWTLSDIRWLFTVGLAAISSRFALPEQGKFNAAEKLNFMMVMGTWPLYIATGVLIWLPGVAFVAWTLHVAMAIVATPLLLGHIFMALINPGTRVGLSGMISGFVDRHWAKHHYRRWYREQFESGAGSERPRRPTPSPWPRPVVVSCSSCNMGHTAPSWNHLLEGVYSSDPIFCSHCNETIDVLSVTSEPYDLEWVLDSLDTAVQGAHEEAPSRLSR